MTELPVIPMTPDVVDAIAREIGLLVADHIETMYPAAAKAVAWEIAARSIQGVVRNAVAAAGKAAERGAAQEWVDRSSLQRQRFKQMWRSSQ